MTCDHLWDAYRGIVRFHLRCLHCGERRVVCRAWGPGAPKTVAAINATAVERGVVPDRQGLLDP